ncbi:hypothetical protein TNCV_1285081 [Trichonephila clavipes]|uniref:Ras-related protein Rab-26 n=1 Tax=Trichonephila clavipes TaxID=2585209 RepID=A0A8X6VP70_TRICX|nr:hypothetical protein TNCV_1285081 [Trichonephila clavipes]
MLVGDSGVGKTCLLVRYKDGAFLSGVFISTVGIDYRAKRDWSQTSGNIAKQQCTAPRERRHWSRHQWVNILLTDESRFCLTIDSQCTFITREPGTRYMPSSIGEKYDYGDRMRFHDLGTHQAAKNHSEFHLFDRDFLTIVKLKNRILESYVHFFW